MQYSLQERRRVRTVSVDLNAGYVNLIPELFPNAKIIIDRFHVVQMAQRSLNEARLAVAKQYDKSSLEYRMLKRYWRLFDKPFNELNAVHMFYRGHLRRCLTSQLIVTKSLALNSRLTQVYHAYQDILTAIQNHDPQLMTKTIQTYRSQHCAMDTTIASFKHNLTAVNNALNSHYSNGPLEGINRKIKVIGRTAYGYRNFDHYRIRIQMELTA